MDLKGITAVIAHCNGINCTECFKPPQNEQEINLYWQTPVEKKNTAHDEIKLLYFKTYLGFFIFISL